MNSPINIKYGLPANAIDSIVSAIHSNKNIKKLVLFGSRAKGNFKKGSDIDLALFSTNLSHDELMKIKTNVNELLLPYTIDILDFNKIKNLELKEHIIRVGVTLFSTYN